MATEKEQAGGADGNEPSQTVVQIPSEGRDGETAAGDKPPGYNEATSAPEPPSSSLLGRVREVQREPSGAVGFLSSFLGHLVTTLGWTYMLAVAVVLPIAMLIVGAIYLNDCPVQKYIPIYMLVGGIFGVGKLLIDIYTRCIKIRDAKRNTTTERRREVGAVDGVVSCFVVAWFIAGCVWIYGAYVPDFARPDSPNYCHKGLYYFAFGVVTSTLVLLGIFISGCCCIGIIAIMVAAKGTFTSQSTMQD